jgi:RNA polymerase sigma-70 factor (ECF subfamily)
MSTITMRDPIKSTTAEFERIYRELAPLVYRTAWGVLGSREDAEDVLQTVFLKLLRREFPPDLHRNPKAYLYRAAINLSLDILKARRRRPVLHLNDVERGQVAASFPDAQFDEDLHQWLYEAISRLNPSAAEILILRYMNNKSVTEIAGELGVSRTVIAVRLFRTRAQLRKLLKARLGERS